MRFLLRLFPRSFRDRYGDEVIELVELSDSRTRDAGDLLLSGLALRGEQIVAAIRGPGRRAGLALAGAAAASVALVGCLVLGSAFAAGALASSVGGRALYARAS